MRGRQTLRPLTIWRQSLQAFTSDVAHEPAPFTPLLTSMRKEVAEIAGISAETLIAATVQYYPEGAGIAAVHRRPPVRCGRGSFARGRLRNGLSETRLSGGHRAEARAWVRLCARRVRPLGVSAPRPAGLGRSIFGDVPDPLPVERLMFGPPFGNLRWEVLAMERRLHISWIGGRIHHSRLIDMHGFPAKRLRRFRMKSVGEEL